MVAELVGPEWVKVAARRAVPVWGAVGQVQAAAGQELWGPWEVVGPGQAAAEQGLWDLSAAAAAPGQASPRL